MARDTKPSAAKTKTKQAAAKKVAPKKAPAKKKVAPKKAPAKKKVAPKKAPAKKVAPKKAPAKKVAPKRAPAKKVVPKVSPKRGLSVDAYVAGLAGWQADAVREIRRLVARLAPKAECSIKWGHPVFDLGGPFAFVRPARMHLTFGFWRGAELEDPSRVLEGSGGMMRHVKIAGMDHLASLPVHSLVIQAVALNERSGDPTRR